MVHGEGIIVIQPTGSGMDCQSFFSPAGWCLVGVGQALIEYTETIVIQNQTGQAALKSRYHWIQTLCF